MYVQYWTRATYVIERHVDVSRYNRSLRIQLFSSIGRRRRHRVVDELYSNQIFHMMVLPSFLSTMEVAFLVDLLTLDGTSESDTARS